MTELEAHDFKDNHGTREEGCSFIQLLPRIHHIFKSGLHRAFLELQYQTCEACLTKQDVRAAVI